MLSREFIRNNVELVKGAIASRQDTAPALQWSTESRRTQ